MMQGSLQEALQAQGKNKDEIAARLKNFHFARDPISGGTLRYCTWSIAHHQYCVGNWELLCKIWHIWTGMETWYVELQSLPKTKFLWIFIIIIIIPASKDISHAMAVNNESASGGVRQMKSSTSCPAWMVVVGCFNIELFWCVGLSDQGANFVPYLLAEWQASRNVLRASEHISSWWKQCWQD